MSEAQGLTPDDVAMLRMEGRTYRFAGVKEQHIRENFGISATRYYQRINSLMDHPQAITHNDGEFAPLINRLRRVRDERRVNRSLPR